jgi:hypothetical protein
MVKINGSGVRKYFNNSTRNEEVAILYFTLPTVQMWLLSDTSYGESRAIILVINFLQLPATLRMS